MTVAAAAAVIAMERVRQVLDCTHVCPCCNGGPDVGSDKSTLLQDMGMLLQDMGTLLQRHGYAAARTAQHLPQPLDCVSSMATWFGSDMGTGTEGQLLIGFYRSPDEPTTRCLITRTSAS